MVGTVNSSNDVLYDLVIPAVLRALFAIKTFDDSVEEQIELVKGYNTETNRVPPFRFRASHTSSPVAIFLNMPRRGSGHSTLTTTALTVSQRSTFLRRF